MKLTWFGGTTVRLQLGSFVVVLDAEVAPAGVVRAELISGADRLITMTDELAPLSISDIRRHQAVRPLDADASTYGILVGRAGDGIVVATPREPPVLFIKTGQPIWRVARDAVVVLFGDGNQMADLGRGAVEAAPKLVVLTGSDADIEIAMNALGHRMDGIGLLALEPNMAIEV